MSKIRTITAGEMTIGTTYRGTADGPAELVGRDFTVEAITEVLLATAAEAGTDYDLQGFAVTVLAHERRDGSGTGHDERLEVTMTKGDAVTERVRFRAGYDQSTTRVLRKGLRVDDQGVATVTFRGTVADVTSAWVEARRGGGVNLFCEVEVTADTATLVQVAVVPTGKRVPALPPSMGGSTEPTLRLGSVGGLHVYLLGVDGTVDRAAYDREQTTKAALRRAEVADQVATMAQAAIDEGDGYNR